MLEFRFYFYILFAGSEADHLLLLQDPGEHLGVRDAAQHGHVLVDPVPVHAAQGEDVTTVPNILEQLHIILRELSLVAQHPVLHQVEHARGAVQAQTGVAPYLIICVEDKH